jgi:DNA-binding transcriptional LysR family regulator
MGSKFDAAVALESTTLLPQLASFVAVVREGSFTKAAKRSGVDKTVLSRRVKRLEQALEVRLLNRTTRSLHVTDAGRRLFDQVADPITDVLMSLGAARDTDVLEGVVRVASISAMGQVWAGVVGQLAERHPALHVELKTADAFVSMVDEGFDVAVRTGYLPDSTLIARKIGRWRYVTVASPEWVEAHGPVSDPSALADHWLVYGTVPRARRWGFENGDAGMTVTMRPRFTSDSVHVLLDAAREGRGVTAAAPYSVERDLADGRLVRVCAPWRVVHVIPVWSVLPHKAYVPARVQAVVEAFTEIYASRAASWDAITGGEEAT